MIEKSKTCSFTGHRIVSSKFNPEDIEKAAYKAINDGFDTFLCGMAIGFDTLCFNVLETVRLEKRIKIIACVPCDSQSKFFNAKQKAQYERMLSVADEVIYVSQEYFDGCMQKRNFFMIDNSSRVIAYLNVNRGGTYQTVKYAVESGVEVEYLGK